MKIERATLPPAPLVVSRALAPLPVLLRLAKPLLADDGFCLFPKTRAAESEITRGGTALVDADRTASQPDRSERRDPAVSELRAARLIW